MQDEARMRKAGSAGFGPPLSVGVKHHPIGNPDGTYAADTQMASPRHCKPPTITSFTSAGYLSKRLTQGHPLLAPGRAGPLPIKNSTCAPRCALPDAETRVTDRHSA